MLEHDPDQAQVRTMIRALRDNLLKCEAHLAGTAPKLGLDPTAMGFFVFTGGASGEKSFCMHTDGQKHYKKRPRESLEGFVVRLAMNASARE